MNREVHVRFRERLGVKVPWPTRTFAHIFRELYLSSQIQKVQPHPNLTKI